MALQRLVYASTAVEPATHASLEALAAEAAAKNRSLGITGLLVYAGGKFMQVLEGEPAAVHDLYATINDDPRHMWVQTFIDEPIHHRLFDAWSMGLCDLDDRSAVGETELRAVHAFLDGCESMDLDVATRGLVHFFLSRVRARAAG